MLLDVHTDPVLSFNTDPRLEPRPWVPIRRDAGSVEKWFGEILDEQEIKWEYERTLLPIEPERENPLETKGVAVDFRIIGDLRWATQYVEVSIGSNKQTLGKKRRRVAKAQRIHGLPILLVERRLLAAIELDRTLLLDHLEPSSLWMPEAAAV